MVTGFVLQYKWLFKLLKGQTIIVMICETVSKEHQADSKVSTRTSRIPSFTRQAMHAI